MRAAYIQDTASLFEQVIDPVQLSLAWEKTRRNKGAAGGDGQTISDFANGAGQRLERLASELRNGLYRPGPLRHVDVPKRRGGGTRRLSIPGIIDRIAQGAAATVLGAYLEPTFEDVSYAYRPGRSVRMAVERVAALRRDGYTWVVDADIRSFFDEIPHAPLVQRLRDHDIDEDLIDLIGLWLESFSDDGRGLAQGSPVSPVLANLYLDALDEAMAGDGVRIVRYADDFVILTRSEKRAHRALDRANRVLGQYGLVLHPEKTSIVPFEKAFVFLGRLFVRALDIPAPDDDTAPDETQITAHIARRDVEIPSFGEDDRTEPAATIVDETPPAGQYLAPGLRPLYVLEPDSQVDAAGQGFSVSNKDGRELLRLPARLVGRIEIGPQTIISPSALDVAMAHQLPVSFLDGYGASRGILRPALHDGGGGLHLAQARLSLDRVACLGMARTLVTARLKNQRALLKRLNRRRKNAEVEKACLTLFRACRKLPGAQNVDQVRGHEGEGGAAYWPALGKCLEHGWKLGTRRIRPAPSPVIAMLDWTASMLLRDVRAAALRVGLHPGFGTLHAVGEKRDACLYDLIETFRAPLAEGLVVYLFNNRILDKQDFTRTTDGVRIASGAGREVVKTYESWMARPIKNPRNGKFTTWRGLLLAECRALALALRADKPSDFTPYTMKF